jgi:hypothetical protein
METSGEIRRGMSRIKLTSSDRDFIVGMSRLVGTSPRNVKRFANICRMIKSHEHWIYDTESSISERFRQIVFLMALAVGCPTIAPTVMRAIQDPEIWGGGGLPSMADFPARFREQRPDEFEQSETLREEWEKLRAFLEWTGQHKDPDMHQLNDWSVDRVGQAAAVASRFTFRL